MRNFKSLLSARSAVIAVTAGLTVALGVTALSGAASAAVFPSASTSTADVAPVPFEALPAQKLLATTEARAALVTATKTNADITASGFDLGAENPLIDTAALHGSLAKLVEFDSLPLMLPAVLKSTATETQRVLTQAAQLRSALDAAIAAKAAADEAARVAAEAAAAAAAQAQAEAEAAAAALAAANTPEGAKATAQQLASANYGWGSDQFSCLVSLWSKESGWNYQAYNDSSGATGIPQSLPGSKMASAGNDWQTNATTQIIWGLDYIAAVYGTPCSAWGHSQATDWY